MAKKTITLEMLRASEGIVKRLNKGEVTKALLCRTKKENILRYLLTGELPEDVSCSQIVNSLFNGDEIKYGPMNNRKTIELPANPDDINDLLSQVPEEELKMPVVKKSVSIKEVKKEAMTNTAKTMLKFNVPMEAIIASTGLTIEEIEALKGE